MHPNEQILNDFYEAFAALNPEGMITHYAPEVAFSDPVFPALNHHGVSGMWRMLCSRAEAFQLTVKQIEANNLAGLVEWEATYRFTQTGRMVTNRVISHFKFNSDRQIELQIDHFPLWRWSRMAIGIPGVLLGWGPLKWIIRRNGAKALNHYLKKTK